MTADADAIAALRAALDAGPTEGPWTAWDNSAAYPRQPRMYGVSTPRLGNFTPWTKADAAFIAACREGVPALLRERAALMAAVARFVDAARIALEVQSLTGISLTAFTALEPLRQAAANRDLAEWAAEAVALARQAERDAIRAEIGDLWAAAAVDDSDPIASDIAAGVLDSITDILDARDRAAQPARPARPATK